MVRQVTTVEVLSLKTPPEFQNSFQCAVWCSIGRGNNWDSEENALLACALLAASENSVTGMDMTRKLFKEAVGRRFHELMPINTTDADRRNESRSELSISRYLTDLSADVQKFRLFQINIKGACPTVVTKAQIIAMATALHVGKAQK